MLATNLPFQARFETKDTTIKAQTSALTINCFKGNYAHTPYFGKLSFYNGTPAALWNALVNIYF